MAEAEDESQTVEHAMCCVASVGASTSVPSQAALVAPPTKAESTSVHSISGAAWMIQ